MLEEPPAGAVIILVGTSRSRQLPTILSRSQVVQVPPAAGTMTSRADRGRRDWRPTPRPPTARRRSDGSLARARELADAALAPCAIASVAAWHGGDIDVARLAHEIDDFIAAAGKEADARRQRFRQLLPLLAVDACGRTTPPDGASPVDSSPKLALAALDRCLEAEEQLDRNANQATLLESWLDDLAALSRSSPPCGHARRFAAATAHPPRAGAADLAKPANRLEFTLGVATAGPTSASRERWQSGRMRRFAKSVTGETWSAGSNPVLSASVQKALFASALLAKPCEGPSLFVSLIGTNTGIRATRSHQRSRSRPSSACSSCSACRC